MRLRQREAAAARMTPAQLSRGVRASVAMNDRERSPGIASDETSWCFQVLTPWPSLLLSTRVYSVVS